MSLLRPTSTPAEQYGFQIIAALGGGIILPGRLLAVQASQAEKDIPIATSLVAFMLSLGQAFGVGVGGTVIQNRWQYLVEDSVAKNKLSPEYELSKSELATAWMRTAQFPPQVQALYRLIMAESISSLYIFLAVLAAIALFISFGIKDLSLDKDGRSSQRFHESRKSFSLLESLTDVSVNTPLRLINPISLVSPIRLWQEFE